MNSQMSSSTNDPELISVKEIKLLEKIGAGANSVVHRYILYLSSNLLGAFFMEKRLQ